MGGRRQLWGRRRISGHLARLSQQRVHLIGPKRWLLGCWRGLCRWSIRLRGSREDARVLDEKISVPAADEVE